MKKDSTTNIDWGELLNYLLEKISSKMPQISFEKLKAEINTYVTYEKSVDEKKNKTIDVLSVKEKSDKEKFVIATNYLRSLLLETPLIAKEISVNLDKLPHEIKFISDNTSINPVTENMEFALTYITLSDEELYVIRTNIDVLYQALEEGEI